MNRGRATHAETPEWWLCTTGVQLRCSGGRRQPRDNLVVLAESGTSADCNLALGSPCAGRCQVFGL